MKTQTGGRIKRLAPYLGNETFMLTWGDGVSDINLNDLLAFHRAHGKLATLTAVRPTARFGHLEMDGNQVVEFSEKPQTKEGWINGAFFVLEPEVFDLHRWRQHSLGEGAARTPGSRRPVDGLSARFASGSAWIPCGKRRSWKSLGNRQRTVENLEKERTNESASNGTPGLHRNGHDAVAARRRASSGGAGY